MERLLIPSNDSRKTSCLSKQLKEELTMFWLFAGCVGYLVTGTFYGAVLYFTVALGFTFFLAIVSSK